jgi:hypothetical protein
MIAPVVTPPAIYCPAPLPSRNVMVWGDDAAMETMRVQFEVQGWKWATVLLGEQTKALVLVGPAGVTDQALCQLVDQVNTGRFGKLSAGFASFGVQLPSPKERGR